MRCIRMRRSNTPRDPAHKLLISLWDVQPALGGDTHTHTHSIHCCSRTADDPKTFEMKFRRTQRFKQIGMTLRGIILFSLHGVLLGNGEKRVCLWRFETTLITILLLYFVQSSLPNLMKSGLQPWTSAAKMGKLGEVMATTAGSSPSCPPATCAGKQQHLWSIDQWGPFRDTGEDVPLTWNALA